MPKNIIEGFLDAAKAASLKKVPRSVAVLFSPTGPRVKSLGIHLAFIWKKKWQVGKSSYVCVVRGKILFYKSLFIYRIKNGF